MIDGPETVRARRSVAVTWTPGTFLWSTLVFFFWIVVIWMFIALFADILRRDMSGWAKAGWIILIVLLPFIGILIYLIARPRTAGFPSPVAIDESRGDSAYGVPGHSAADEISSAARLRDEGTITAAEFERLKLRALNY
jgi:hypothetical protein